MMGGEGRRQMGADRGKLHAAPAGTGLESVLGGVLDRDVGTTWMDQRRPSQGSRADAA